MPADHYGAVATGRPKTAMSRWKNVLDISQIWDVISYIYIGHLFNHQWEKDLPSEWPHHRH